jgi:hypothetical protein
MKLPRSSIAGLMTLVAFVAANCAIVKTIMARPSVWNEVFIFGALPMANLLAFGLLPWLRRSPDRSRFGGFRVGFEICGWVATAAFLVLSLRFTDQFFVAPQQLGSYLALKPGLGLVSCALVTFVGPQLAVAVLGGWLGRVISNNLNRHAIRNRYGVAPPG